MALTSALHCQPAASSAEMKWRRPAGSEEESFAVAVEVKDFPVGSGDGDSAVGFGES